MDGVRSNLGWRSCWWMVLWAGAVLQCSFHMAQPQPQWIPLEVDPLIPTETKEVLISPPIPPSNIMFCTWYHQRNGGKWEEMVTVYPNKDGNIVTDERITVYSNCTLHIKELTKDDSANYMLLEGGPAFSNRGNVTVNVVEIVLKPKVIIRPCLFLKEFQPVSLHCITNITKDVRWFKDDILLDEGYVFTNFNQTLHIASVTRKDTGEYRCQVSNGFITMTSDPVHLGVIYGPEKPVIRPNDVCNEEHINIILSCKAKAYPEPQYAWFRDGVLLDDGPKLFIENFSESQAGGYVCEANNQLLHKSKTSDTQQIRLKKSCVSGVTITGPQEGTEGKSTSLYCTAEGDEIEYFWTKDDQPLNENEHVDLTSNGQTLVFNPCDRSDAANYKCHASNSFSSGESDPFDLIIIYGPDPPFINETIDLINEIINLMCITVAYPATKNEWYYNGHLVENNPEVLTRKIIEENSGDYTCRATNPKSNMTGETTLEIDMIGKLKSLRRR